MNRSQRSDEPFSAGWELVFPAIENEVVLRKSDSDAFASNPGLVEILRQQGIDTVVIAGM